MSILLFFIGPIGRYISIAAIASIALGGVYTKGRLDGRASYKLKVERQINEAILKGDHGRVDALKQLDAGRVPEYWFRD